MVFKMKRILLMLMFGIFLISFVSADLGTYKQGEIILVKGNLNATAVNVSIHFPNSSIAVDNQVMGNLRGDIWGYNFSNTNTQGRYIYDYCNEIGKNCKENIFTITPTGIIQNPLSQNAEFFILLFLIIIFLGLGVGFRLPTLGFIGSILVLLLGIYTMIYGFNDVTNLYTRGSAIAIIGLGFIFMFISAYEWIPWGKEE